MFVWDEKYKWGFDKGGISDSVGPNEADTGIYEGHPFKGLAKEILQNSLDAKDPDLDDAIPVKVDFSLLYLPKNEIPDADRLDEVISHCSEMFSTGDDGKKLNEWKKQSHAFLMSDNLVPVLKISDYNTKGLDGVTKTTGTSWSALVRQKGTTNKGDGAGGSHGVGKFAPYSFSAVRTVLYSTMNKAGETAFQGKSILTSFFENNQMYQNIGVFGDSSISETYPAIFDTEDLPEPFRRTECGTDVIAVAFDRQDDWMEQIALSILQYCFYTIYKGQLEVSIIDGEKKIILKQSNLQVQMDFFEEWNKNHEASEAGFDFTAPEYLRVLRNEKTIHIPMQFPDDKKPMGEVELYLLVDNNIPNRGIYEMRKTGMEITEDTKWKIGAHFRGLFIATGNNSVDNSPETNIDSFLRHCEDQAHNEWAAAFYKQKQKEAAKIIGRIHTWILENVKKEIIDIDGPAHNAYGLEKYLKNTFATGDDKDEEEAYQNYKPLNFKADQLDMGTNKKAVISQPSNGGSHSKRKKKNCEKQEQSAKNPNNKQHKKQKPSEQVGIGYVQCPYNEITGKYRISFMANEDFQNLSLLLRINNDGNSSYDAAVSNANINGKELNILDDRIYIGNVNKGQRVQLETEIINADRLSLEVIAYAEQ